MEASEATGGHTITVLHVPGCAGGRGAMAVAEKIAAERPGVRVESIVVEDEAQAMARGFRGSPTVLVDGDDVEDDPRPPIGSIG